MTDTTEEHAHIWGEIQHGYLSGEPSRPCIVDGCRFISLDLTDDEPDDESDDNTDDYPGWYSTTSLGTVQQRLGDGVLSLSEARDYLAAWNSVMRFSHAVLYIGNGPIRPTITMHDIEECGRRVKCGNLKYRTEEHQPQVDRTA